MARRMLPTGSRNLGYTFCMLLTFQHGDVRELRLNRPPVNALTGELLSNLRQAIEQSAQEGARAVILSGLPGRFSGGLDVPLLLTLDKPAMSKLWRELYATLEAIARSPVPVVAAITGHAPAGGTVLALFCDWRVMAQGEYKLGLNEVQVGIPLPPVIMGGLRRLVGPRRAEYLGVSGSLVSPEQALAAGLVDEVVPADEVVPHALAWCNKMLALPKEAMTMTRREARRDLHELFESGMDAELTTVIANWWTPATQETLRGLVEKMKKKGT